MRSNQIIRCFCIAILFSLTVFEATAQLSGVDLLFSDLQRDQRFTQVTISGKMFELMTSIEPETNEERAMLEAISDLSGLKILACGACENREALYNESIATLENSSERDYEVLLEISNEREQETFFVHDSDGEVRELVLIGYADNEFFMLSLTGIINLDQIANIGRAMEVDGLDRLENLDQK